jgi:hypothetical protein
MADYILIVQGCEPWRPSPDAITEHVLQRYTIPLSGIVSQHEVKYLFWCFGGQASEYNMWAYTLLNEEEAIRLREAPGSGLVPLLREVTPGRGAVVALANDAGILFSGHYDTGMAYGDEARAVIAEIAQRLLTAQQEAAALLSPA